MELLREQYARGEISDEEFDERSSRLAGVGVIPPRRERPSVPES